MHPRRAFSFAEHALLFCLCFDLQPYLQPQMIDRILFLSRYLWCLGLIGLLSTQGWSQPAVNWWQPAASRPAADELMVQADLSQLEALLATAPMETDNAADPLWLSLPSADGTPLRTRVVEASLMAPSLAARFGIRSFSGQSAAGYVRMSLTPEGLYAVVFGETDTRVIEPVDGMAGLHRVRSGQEAAHPEEALALCGVDPSEMPAQRGTAQRTISGELYEYRLALATSAEYTAFHGGSMASVMSALAEALTYINGVLERDVAIRLTMIAENDQIIFFDPDTDPYTYNALGANLGENQQALDAILGSSAYDIGHVFTQVTPPPNGSYTAGVAIPASVCSNNVKARGASSQPSPIGESFYQIALHEIGHQFSAGHTWNANAGSCTGGQYQPSSAWEPGSGSTIMSYVGVCGPHNITSVRDGYFHGGTIEEMFTFSRSGGSCANQISIGNQSPQIEMPPSGKVLPYLTPFALTGSATDPDGDTLTYCWEQLDLGPAGDPRNPVGSAPLFRSWRPTGSDTRYFPRLFDLRENGARLGEYLPDYDRGLTFRLTVRDLHLGAGGVEWDEVSMSVTDQAGPFLVTQPSASGITWGVGSVQKVRWDVAKTNLPPVDAPRVDVLLSTDGGLSFPHLLLSSTPNDGETEIVVPDLPGNQCRVMVRASDHFFFNISDKNFTIEPASGPDFALYSPDPVGRLCAGGSVSLPVVAQPQGGFSDMVNLVVGTLPAGVTSTLNPASVAPGDTAFIELSAAANAPGGLATFQVLGSASGGFSDFRGFSLEVAAAEAQGPTLLAPMVGERGTSRKPSLSWEVVPGADTYQLEVAASPSFTSNTLTADGLQSTQYQVVAQLSESRAYYWRVTAVDACGDTLRSQVGAFQTGACQRALPGNLPQDIPALDAPHTLTSSVVMGLNATVEDVNVVNLQGQHSSVSDLRATLRSPAGTEVRLIDRICSSADKNFRLGLDDEADLANAPCAPTGGQRVQPEEALSAFDGENAPGSWQLVLSDLAEFDGGTWYNWELEVCAEQNQGPELVTNEPFTLLAGFAGYIDSSSLKMVDHNFDPPNLFFTLVEGPLHGELRQGPVILSPGSFFVQEKVDQSQLIYLHDGGSSPVDSFIFAIENPNQGWSGLYTFHLNIDGVTELSEVAPEEGLSMFPVPARDRLTLRWSTPLATAAELTLVDLQGRQVKQTSVSPGQAQYQWNVATISAGLYLLRVNQGGKSTSYKVSLKD